MIIHQFFVPVIAHSSYIVAGDKTCAVIDPERDVTRYLEAATQMGLRITHILETHLHADFVSGHLDLADATGAEIIAPKSGHCAFPHTPVADGDVVNLEHIRFTVISSEGAYPGSGLFPGNGYQPGSDPGCALLGRYPLRRGCRTPGPLPGKGAGTGRVPL